MHASWSRGRPSLSHVRELQSHVRASLCNCVPAFAAGAMLLLMADMAHGQLAGTKAGAAGTGQVASSSASVEKTLYMLEDQFAHAVVKRDAATLRRLVAPKWVYSDETGVMEREAGIAAFTTGTDTVREASNADMRALVYGNSAVVIGILQMKGRGAHGAFTHRYRYTDTWVLADGTWKCVASQDYLMPDAKR